MDDQTTMNGGSTALPRSWTNPLDHDRMDLIQARARDLDARARTLVRENPVAVVLAAVAVGFLVGRLLVRR